ncbi:MAG: hypothetical protein HeimC3_38560 [Candidatus Heimdallarchaeota archaeon LC_3]|nr:MAG: hypothetical protein HeimC3_38560 [Candidatus Heimdallarchaeota archaeon LC_3]
MFLKFIFSYSIMNRGFVISIVIMIFLIVSLSFSLNVLGVPDNTTSQHTLHDPIDIDSNTDLINQALLNSWVGNGSAANPFLIENLLIVDTLEEAILIGSVSLHVKISNNQIEKTGAGIIIYDSSNIVISNNVITQKENKFMIETIALQNTSNISIINNIIHSLDNDPSIQATDTYYFGEGLMVFDSSNIKILNNQILTSTLAGIRIAGSNDCFIKNNTIANSVEGIIIHGSINSNVINNSFSNTGLTLYDPLENIQTYEVEGNLVNDKPLVFFVNVTGDSIPNYSEIGQLILYNVNDTAFSNINIHHAFIGVYLQECQNISFSQGILSNNIQKNIFISDSSNIVIEDLTIRGSTIHISHTNNTIITRNKLQGNHTNEGINLRSSYNSIISKNIINNYTVGIALSKTVNTSITDNNLSNMDLGLNIETNQYNHLISRNIFINVSRISNNLNDGWLENVRIIFADNTVITNEKTVVFDGVTYSLPSSLPISILLFMAGLLVIYQRKKRTKNLTNE